MKLYLDDVRPTPEGYVRCYWPSEVLQHLLSGLVEEVSLDHDIGDADAAKAENRKERTGMDVLTWIQKQVVQKLAGFTPPVMKVHSNNAAAIRDMATVIRRIEELHRELNPEFYKALEGDDVESS